MKTFNDNEENKRNEFENTFDEIAGALGYTRQTIINEQNKALKKARRLLKNKGYNADHFFKD